MFFPIYPLKYLADSQTLVAGFPLVQEPLQQSLSEKQDCPVRVQGAGEGAGVSGAGVPGVWVGAGVKGAGVSGALVGAGVSGVWVGAGVTGVEPGQVFCSRSMVG